VPEEYWEYVLLDTFFRGNWLVYVSTPEYILQRIRRFKDIEARIQINERTK